MALVFLIILLSHTPPLYASGGIYVANTIFIAYILIKSASVRRIRRWPIVVLLAPVIVMFMDAIHGPSPKSIVASIYLAGLIYVFPNITYPESWLEKQKRLMVWIAILFLIAFIAMNLSSFGSFDFAKEGFRYPLATPNLMGVLAVFVIILSLENRFHWSMWGIGVFSLTFMPVFFGAYLSLAVYIFWRLPRSASLPMFAVALAIFVSKVDLSLLTDSTMLNFAASGRFDIWAESSVEIAKHPWIGIGQENWDPFFGTFINPHNFIIYFILSYGYILGALLALLTVYLVYQRGRNQCRDEPSLKAYLISLLAYQCVYVGTLGHFSPFGNLLTLLYGMHLCRTKNNDIQNRVINVPQVPLAIGAAPVHKLPT